MRPIVIDNFPFPKWFWFDAMTLWPFILLRGSVYEHDARLLRHELEHWYQAKRYFVLPFYVLYVISWVINLVKYGNFYAAYLEIGFERQARLAESQKWTDQEVEWIYEL